MPQVLTTNALILCPHTGQGRSVSTNPRWSVNGGIVLVENDIGTLPDCKLFIYPCVGYRLQSMGLNATQIDGRPVILTTDFNRTFTGFPLTMIETHPVIDNSTPAPIPGNQSAPPLSPALADMTKPILTGTPPALAFSLTTQQPTTVTATFTLLAAHPLKWILTLINEPRRTNTDVTDGQPPGLIVSPAGGVWGVPSLTITVTMNAAFMTSLTPGKHRFFMTGVSERGLSSFFEIDLLVSV